MNLFELFAKLGVDSSEFEKGIADAEKSGKSLKDSLSNSFDKIKKVAAVALSGAALKKGIDTMLELANETAAVGDKIDKQSQVLGLSRKAYQEWDYILSQNGASIDSLGAGMRTLNKLMLEAAGDGEEAKDTFAKLGMSFHEIENLSPEGQFEAVVKAFQRMPAGAKKSALAVEVFGRSGMQLLPLLNQSETSIDELRQKAEELGLIMSDDAVDASVAYGDALDTLKRTFNGLKYSIGAKILPFLTTGMESITKFAGKLRKAYDDKGLAGVWDTLVEGFRSINWPTWSEIGSAVTAGWNTIVDGVKKLPGLVFGTKEDGSVDWPDWDTVKKFAIEKWNGIKAGVKTLAGLVFGTKADGSVDWPDWYSVQEKAQQIWADIKKKAREVGGIVFGKKEDGSVAWPDVSKLATDFNTWWQNTAVPALKSAMVWTLTLFGMPEESAESIASIVSTWWGSIVDTLTSVLNWVLNLPDTPYEAGQQLHEIISKWWESIKSYAEGALNWVLGLFDIGDENGSKTLAKISGWWNGTVVPLLIKGLNFVLGLFDLPDAGAMKNKIITWWNNVKNMVGNLILNIIPNILSPGTPERVGQAESGNYGGHNGTWEWQGDNYVWTPNAKGLNYVPYNGYKAVLHRGEQVLTASQARANRSGRGSTFDMNSLATAVAGAVRAGMTDATVESYLDGKNVTGGVNRRTMNQLKARRFAK